MLAVCTSRVVSASPICKMRVMEKKKKEFSKERLEE